MARRHSHAQNMRLALTQGAKMSIFRVTTYALGMLLLNVGAGLAQTAQAGQEIVLTHSPGFPKEIVTYYGADSKNSVELQIEKDLSERPGTLLRYVKINGIDLATHETAKLSTLLISQQRVKILSAKCIAKSVDQDQCDARLYFSAESETVKPGRTVSLSCGWGFAPNRQEQLNCAEK